jgi:hypothetical protein
MQTSSWTLVRFSLLLVGLLLLSVSPPVGAQAALPSAATQSAPQIDPAAVPLIQKALLALGGAPVTDVTLTGTATRTAGSYVETGSITLKALGANQSRLDLAVVGGTWTEVRGINSQGAPQGSWTSLDGKTHPAAGHNILTDAVWFFPALSALDHAASPQLGVTYVGTETRDGATVQHLHFASPDPSLPPDASLPPHFSPRVAELTTMDVYLDPASSLPVAVTFNMHPDNNALIDIPVEVDFSNYQAVNGVQVPFRIQKSLNGTLFYDITIQSASVNSGLTATEFAVQ